MYTCRYMSRCVLHTCICRNVGAHFVQILLSFTHPAHMHNHPTYTCMCNLHVFSFESNLCSILHICTIILHKCAQSFCINVHHPTYMCNLHVFSFESNLCSILHICIILHIHVCATCMCSVLKATYVVSCTYASSYIYMYVQPACVQF